jgi:ABC-type transport system involved in Fe-S cluster assembly fused permease/ATPase subunit
MKYEIYKSLSKEDKKRVRDGYASTKKGDYVLKKINRLLVYSIIYLILAIVITYLLIIDYLGWSFIILDVGLIICFIVFSIGHYKLKMETFCRYINVVKQYEELKQKNLSKKKKK